MSTYQETMASLKKEFTDQVKVIEAQPGAASVEELRLLWLGRKGKLTQQFANLKQASKKRKESLFFR